MSRLERWSRLKRNVPQAQDAPTAPLPGAESDDELAAQSEVSPDALKETPDQASPEPSPSEPSPSGQAPSEPAPKPGSLDHTLPDPETLEAGSDFSAFMVPGVSGALRRRALKRLWATGNYNVRDGLDDYDADYNQLLKPMSSELASKLRRWTHKVEEAVDKSLNEAEAESEPQKELAADEQTNEQAVTLEEEASTDQADDVSGAKTKT